jgi:hypothetical protein
MFMELALGFVVLRRDATESSACKTPFGRRQGGGGEKMHQVITVFRAVITPLKFVITRPARR